MCASPTSPQPKCSRARQLWTMRSWAPCDVPSGDEGWWLCLPGSSSGVRRADGGESQQRASTLLPPSEHAHPCGLSAPLGPAEFATCHVLGFDLQRIARTGSARWSPARAHRRLVPRASWVRPVVRRPHVRGYVLYALRLSRTGRNSPRSRAVGPGRDAGGGASACEKNKQGGAEISKT